MIVILKLKQKSFFFAYETSGKQYIVLKDKRGDKIGRKKIWDSKHGRCGYKNSRC